MADNILTGVAGEFSVAAELSKRGWIATLTAKNTPVVDLLAARPKGQDTDALRVQVKTRTPAYKYAWRCAPITLAGPRDIVVFVDLGAIDEAVRYWIVPAAEAAAKVTKHDQVKLKDIEPLEDRWDLFDAPAPEAPVAA